MEWTGSTQHLKKWTLVMLGCRNQPSQMESCGLTALEGSVAGRRLPDVVFDSLSSLTHALMLLCVPMPANTRQRLLVALRVLRMPLTESHSPVSGPFALDSLLSPWLSHKDLWMAPKPLTAAHISVGGLCVPDSPAGGP
ncbi:hypothetical protein E2C01_079800 [Portunus trituberculatus]|uniref:Uncharacterized protein n=1 Tax=Portunus trituberculatus TaxID=210409 RepID=A0A5B7IMF3_PORTR|nr:hypothetical protein [Portunus trituberculatus]